MVLEDVTVNGQTRLVFQSRNECSSAKYLSGSRNIGAPLYPIRAASFQALIISHTA
jgi:hypothetical protein